MIIAKIKEIEWIDKDTLEAEVLFEINNNEYWAFSHPCEFQKNKTYQLDFDFLEDGVEENIFWSENRFNDKGLIKDTKDRLRYYCYGQIISIDPIQIDLGDIQLDYGSIYNYKSVVGKYVYFVISRLDLILIKEL